MIVNVISQLKNDINLIGGASWRYGLTLANTFKSFQSSIHIKKPSLAPSQNMKKIQKL